MTYHRAKRYTPGIVVYNTNNYTKAVVLDGTRGEDNDPGSLILEMNGQGKILVHTPPNRALIPTGEYFDISGLTKILTNREELKEDEKGDA